MLVHIPFVVQEFDHRITKQTYFHQLNSGDNQLKQRVYPYLNVCPVMCKYDYANNAETE